MSRDKIVSDFNDFLDKATSPMQLEPNAEAVANVCKMIDEAVIEPEEAIEAIHGKIIDVNPHTTYFALELLQEVFYKCGSLVHKVVCTNEYMELLKDIIKTTDHKKIKDKIVYLLIDWADKFKYLPHYCEPQNLLIALHAEGLIFPQIKCENSDLKSTTMQVNNSMCSDSMKEENASANGESLELNDNNFDYNEEETYEMSKSQIVKTDDYKYDKKNSEISSELELQDRDDFFKSQLKEIQQIKRRKHKEFLKAKGVRTSSDEEEITIIEPEKDSSSHNVSSWPKKVDDCFLQNSEKPKKLLKELEEYRQQRRKLNSDAKEVRGIKHQSYMQNCTSHNPQLKQCQDKCKECEIRKSEHKEYVVPKSKLSRELRKIKESRKNLEDSYEECKALKKEQHYENKNSSRSSFTHNSKDKKTSMMESEDKELQRVLMLSKQESQSFGKAVEKPFAFGTMQEKRRLQLDDSYLTFLHEEQLKEVINLSLAQAEAEKKKSSLVQEPDNDDMEMNFAKQLNLDESDTISEFYEDNKWIQCYICFEMKERLRAFKPCGHRCICNNCIEKFCSQKCPVCDEFYTSILL